MNISKSLDKTVNKSLVDSSARITGQSYLVGPNTRVGAGAVVENSYLENAAIEPGAVVIDSVLVTKGLIHKHRCDAAGHWVSGGSEVVIGSRAEVRGSVLANSSVGAGTKCIDSSLEQSTVGGDCELQTMKGILMTAGQAVRVIGPTEISESWLGHHATIDRCGYFEGVFSNDFHVLEFDETTGALRVKETLDIPHASRYGMNSIHSTNSGKLLPQADGILKSFGPLVKLWHDPLLSHEPIMLGPCCLVSGWTKVIGQSTKPHNSPDELVADTLATYLMPFSVNCIDGQTVWGQVTPGERYDGPSHKQRKAAWTFIYAPEAVINMVRRIHEALPAEKREIADRLAELSLRNCDAMVRAMAHVRGVNLDNPSSSRGWSGWLADAGKTIGKLLESGLWKFENGQPLSWRQQDGRWKPEQSDIILAIAPDALENQLSEEEILATPHSRLEHRLGLDAKELGDFEAFVSKEAKVAPDAFIGPGVRITGRSVVESGARLWRTIVHDGHVGRNAEILRSVVRSSDVGADARIVSALMNKSSVGPDSSVECARMDSSRLSDQATVSPFGNLQNVTATKPVIIGGAMRNADIRTVLMTMHMAGVAEHIKAHPVYVEIDGRKEEIWPVPMLGGGSRLLGTAKNPIDIEGAFIGSNAIVEAGAYIGFGCFVLGTLTGDEGLPPFTLSTSPGPEGDCIGAVLVQFANLVITHMIGWTYQAAGADKTAVVAALMQSQIRTGIAAVEWAMKARTEDSWDKSSPFARFKSLRLYSEKQLLSGLETYRSELADERWRLAFANDELRFTGNGVWHVADGIARWE